VRAGRTPASVAGRGVEASTAVLLGIDEPNSAMTTALSNRPVMTAEVDTATFKRPLDLQPGRRILPLEVRTAMP
jgi:hypothetical protein